MGGWKHGPWWSLTVLGILDPSCCPNTFKSASWAICDSTSPPGVIQELGTALEEVRDPWESRCLRRVLPCLIVSGGPGTY